jgi:hypothetical protein
MRTAGRISEDDHAILRASHIAQSELMNLTLGDDEALTEQSISRILERTKEALVAEITRSHGDEIARRDARQVELETELAEQRLVAERERAERDREAAADRERLEAALRAEQTRALNEQQHQQRVAEKIATFVVAIPGALLATALVIGTLLGIGMVRPEAMPGGLGSRAVTGTLIFATALFGCWSLIAGDSLGGLLRRPRDRLAARILRSLRRGNS